MLPEYLLAEADCVGVGTAVSDVPVQLAGGRPGTVAAETTRAADFPG